MRNIEKAISDYQAKFGNNTRNGAYYTTDLLQIRDAVEGLTGGERDFELISMALQAGFMIGYRKGQTDAKKGKANNV